jgi:hypothetical protein
MTYKQVLKAGNLRSGWLDSASELQTPTSFYIISLQSNDKGKWKQQVYFTL